MLGTENSESSMEGAVPWSQFQNESRDESDIQMLALEDNLMTATAGVSYFRRTYEFQPKFSSSLSSSYSPKDVTKM